MSNLIVLPYQINEPNLIWFRRRSFVVLYFGIVFGTCEVRRMKRALYALPYPCASQTRSPDFLPSVRELPTLILLTDTLDSCLLVPITRNSVLSSFNINLSLIIHERTSAMHFSIASRDFNCLFYWTNRKHFFFVSFKCERTQAFARRLIQKLTFRFKGQSSVRGLRLSRGLELNALSIKSLRNTTRDQCNILFNTFSYFQYSFSLPPAQSCTKEPI